MQLPFVVNVVLQRVLALARRSLLFTFSFTGMRNWMYAIGSQCDVEIVVLWGHFSMHGAGSPIAFHHSMTSRCSNVESVGEKGMDEKDAINNTTEWRFAV
jgi:hypothetical protein